LMLQRVWVETLPRRKHWVLTPLLVLKEVAIMGDIFVVG
jgi:hypothetical protein